MSTFAPSVLVDGKTVTPPGWMWVLAFAIRDVPWAVAEVCKPDFEQRIRDWHHELRTTQAEATVAALEARLAAAKQQLQDLRARHDRRDT